MKTRVTITRTSAKKLDIALCNFFIDMMLPLWVEHWFNDDIGPPVLKNLDAKVVQVEIPKKVF